MRAESCVTLPNLLTIYLQQPLERNRALGEDLQAVTLFVGAPPCRRSRAEGGL